LNLLSVNRIVAALVFIPVLLTNIYATDVYIKLTAHGQRINIGLANLPKEIQTVVRQDLLFTRYFNIIPSEMPFSGKKEELVEWQKQNADVLLTASLNITGSNGELSAKMYDVNTGKIIFNKSFTDRENDWRKLAHELSDEIVLRFTGENGIAHTKIVFANDGTGNKEVYTVDYDGYNLKRITDDKSINLFPKFSPDGKQIIFTTYKYGNPDLYIMNPDGRKKKSLSTYQGLNTPANWSPNGKEIVLTLSKGSLPDIYRLNLEGEIIKRVTFGKCINTSPNFSPNEREIIFVSNRSGSPQLHVSDINGTNVRRITTEGYSDSPDWSPRGDKIVFSMRIPGRDEFDIFIYDITAGKYYPLTYSSGSNENPCFSPDGRFIVFSSTRNKHRELFMMFVDGTGQRRVCDIKGNSFMPHWSN